MKWFCVQTNPTVAKTTLAGGVRAAVCSILKSNACLVTHSLEAIYLINLPRTVVVVGIGTEMALVLAPGNEDGKSPPCPMTTSAQYLFNALPDNVMAYCAGIEAQLLEMTVRAISVIGAQRLYNVFTSASDNALL